MTDLGFPRSQWEPEDPNGYRHATHRNFVLYWSREGCTLVDEKMPELDRADIPSNHGLYYSLDVAAALIAAWEGEQ